MKYKYSSNQEHLRMAGLGFGVYITLKTSHHLQTPKKRLIIFRLYQQLPRIVDGEYKVGCLDGPQ